MGRLHRLFGDGPRHATVDVTDALRPFAKPLRSESDLDPLIERIGDARLVLLGEASHGTSEFYTWRAALSRRLIQERGFSFVAVEGDWPDCERINRYVKAEPGAAASAEAALRTFNRWPTWMWANYEVLAFVRWLRAHNDALAPARRVGFFGLDVYSLWDSMAAVIEYLDRVDPDAARRARTAYECFAPFEDNPEDYAYASALAPTSCEDEVVRVLSEVRRKAETGADGQPLFFAEQNAIVARNAEAYYRSMIRGGAESWNVRDRHMSETLDRLLEFHGPSSKAIVWEHNTHIGDARFTDMVDEGEVNVGQLARERYGNSDVVLVGFSTLQGRVIAADRWGAPLKSLEVPRGRAGSYEDVLHQLGLGDALLVFPEEITAPELLERRGHRAIGVVYRPSLESYGNYVPSVLPRRYDALLFIETSKAVEPLVLYEREAHEPGETYPSGV